MKHLLLSAVILPLILCNTAAQTNWVMGDYDPQRTSWVPDSDFAPPLTLHIYDYPEPLASTAGFKTYQVTYADGIAYMGIGAGPIGNAVAAFDFKAGTILWNTTIEGGVGGIGNAPVITENRVVAGGQGGAALLTGIDRETGAVVWTKSIGSMYTREITLYEGRMYVCTDSVYCMDPETGSVFWKQPTENTQGSAPAFSGEFMAHLSRSNVNVRDINTGKLLWQNGPVSKEGLTVDDTRVYVSNNNSVKAYNLETGALEWEHELADSLSVTFLFNALARTDKTLFCALSQDSGENDNIRALDLNDGSVQWNYTAEGAGVLSLAIVNGIIYHVQWEPNALIGIRTSDGTVAATVSGAHFRTRVIYGNRRLFAGYEYDPLVGGGLAVLASPATAVGDVPVPRPDEMQVYPNPVHSAASVTYTLSETANVTLRVFDALGREIALQEIGRKEPGSHTALLGNNALPASLPAGVYTVMLQAGERMLRRNMVLAR